MNMFSSVRHSFGVFLSPRKPSQSRVAVWEHDLDEEVVPYRESSILGTDLQDLENETLDHTADIDFEGDTLPVDHGTSKKRNYSPTSDDGSTKRCKTMGDDEDLNDFEGETLLTTTPAARFRSFLPRFKAATDRILMPPPALPGNSRERRTSAEGGSEDDLSEIGYLVAGPMSKRTANAIDDFNVELARRDAEAIQLPANSGVWARAEKDLFQHLALRGFEPLLPENWMIDFRTLPLSLYAREGSRPPLISAKYEAEFRAIRALRDLIDLGQKVRDRALARRKLQPEPAIEQGICKYISWALRDVGMHKSQRPGVIPVHVITTMGRDQTTQEAIQELKTDLHILATRWRRVHNIYESVEARNATPISTEETQITEAEDDDLPTLTGILVCSSLMMVVTLNAHTPTPPSLARYNRKDQHMLSSKSTSTDVLPKTDQDLEPQATPEPTIEDSGLRVIATFDFSDARQDVWNALAVAIVAMCARNTIVQQFQQASRSGGGTMWETAEQKGPSMRGGGLDDPDA